MSVINIAAAAAFAASLVSHVAPALADAPCDGVYQSFGRGCHGTLFIREKTIEWNSPWSVCKSSPHKILDSDLDHKPRRVVYQIVAPSKACRYAVIEIVEHSGEAEGWSINGYPSVEAYEKRDDDDWVLAGDKTGEMRAGSSCPVEPMPSKRCNLPFARKKK